MKIQILFLVVILSIPGPFVLSGLSSSPDKSGDKATKSKLDVLKKDIKNLNSQIIKLTPESHELHDYFIESNLSIARLVGFIEQDVTAGDLDAAGRGLKEAEFLSSFLKEELSVIRAHDNASFRVIDVTSFGLKGDGVSDNSDPLQRLLTTVKNYKGHHLKLLFPEGNYYIKAKPEGKAISLKDMENIMFEGSGKVTLIFNGQEPGANLDIQNCRNLEFRNISIDMNPLPFTMGTIVSVEDGNKIIIKRYGNSKTVLLKKILADEENAD